MGRKRKARALAPPKKRHEKLETVFCCPFCNHPGAVECRIDRKLQVGEATCRVCAAGFATGAHALTEPIDVYTDWLDECERLNT